MTTATPSLTVMDGEGENTRVHYVMSDRGKKLAESDVVLAGRLTPTDIESIQAALASDDGFEPDDVGIPRLEERMPLSWSPSGYETHGISRIAYTSTKPSGQAPDADHFAVGFEKIDIQAHLHM